MLKRHSGHLSPGRRIAFAVLEEVANGAFASDALREAARNLSPRDAGLAGQIVLGSLRVQNQLDHLIHLYSGRSVDTLDVQVRIALRAAIYQIRYLERIPSHAAVHDSVEFVKYAKRAASGLTNAVLRKAGKEEITWPNESLQYACPQWLLDRWIVQFGHPQALLIAQAAMFEPPRYIRVKPGSELPSGIEVEATEVPGCYLLLSSDTETCRLHDISAQAIIPLLNLQPGQTYLDLCAAPGNKTLQALETPLQLAIAGDISPKRLQAMPPACHRVVLDATQRLPFALKFDRVFVDAPCSGTGTLARNPEIKWRLQPAELARFGRRQVDIVNHATAVVAEGGLLLYATCSLEYEESTQVIAEAVAANPDLECQLEQWRLPGRESGDGFYAALLGPKR